MAGDSRWSDEPHGAPRVAVLGDGLWRRRFAADPSLVGQTIAINGEPHIVVGIMPARLSLRSTGAQLWLPLGFTPRELQMPGARYLSVTGRLRPGITGTQAQAELAEIARRTEKVRPQSNTNVTARVRSLHEVVVSQVRDAAFILLAAVSFVLLIACANVANLLLARATRRQAEMSVRAALGASRSRIARQLLIESAVIGLAGAVAGLALAYVMAEILKNVLPEDIPRLRQTRVDAVVLGFTLAVSLVASLLFGVAPALRASRTELQQALRDESRSSGGFRRRRLSSGIVATEIALALVLLVAAGLLLRSFVRLQRVELGFDPANLATARMNLPETRYGPASEVAAFYEELATRLGQQPGVTAAAVASNIPLTGSGISISMTIEGRPRPARVEDTPNVFSRFVSADYFRTLGVRVARGRDFSSADRANAPAVAIVNETTARRYWPDQDPLGQRFKLDDDREGAVEIVGVVADVKHFGLARSPEPEVFMPLPQTTLLHWQWMQRSMIAIARTSGEPESAAGAIRQAVRALDDQLPLYNLRSMEQLRVRIDGGQTRRARARRHLRRRRAGARVDRRLWRDGRHGGGTRTRDRHPSGAWRQAQRRALDDLARRRRADRRRRRHRGDRGVRTHEDDGGDAVRDAGHGSRDVFGGRGGHRDRGDARLLGAGTTVNSCGSSHRPPRGVKPGARQRIS